jgi:PAS domain S-box-containing protein
VPQGHTNWEIFAERLTDARLRLHGLRTRYDEAQVTAAPEMVAETLEELESALQQLAAAQEELRGQTDELLEARTALQDQRQRYRRLFDSAPAAYLVTTLDAVVVDANRPASALLGIKTRFLIGKPLAIFVTPRDRHAFRDRLLVLKPQDSMWDDWMFEMQPRDRQPFEASASVVSGIDPVRGRRELQWLIFDVTARRREERAMQEANAELERRVAERTRELEQASDAKDEFLATLSHELRTPVNVIRGFARMLTEGTLDADGGKRAIAAIERNAARQTRLIGDLLDASRITMGRFELRRRQMDLGPVIEAAVENARESLESNELQLTVERPDEPAWVWGDPDRLQQAVDNLLSNALKFTPPGGDIWVTLARGEHDWIVAVRDTGIGIAPESMSALFQRFKQAQNGNTRAHGGLGLGLSIVDHIIKQHGGTVRAHSEGHGTGATFTLTVPIAMAVQSVAETGA